MKIKNGFGEIIHDQTAICLDCVEKKGEVEHAKDNVIAMQKVAHYINNELEKSHNRVKELEKFIDEECREGHRYCEDGWYSCPLASEGCSDDSIDQNKCNCGADKKNKEIDNILRSRK